MYKTIVVLLLLLHSATAEAQAETVTLDCKGTISSIRADGSALGDPADPFEWHRRMTLDVAAGKVALEPWSPSQIDPASGSTIKFSHQSAIGPRGNIDRVTGETWVESGDVKLTTRREGTCRPVQRLF